LPGGLGALPVLQQLPTARETLLFRFPLTSQRSATITKHCLGWAGGEKGARGREAGETYSLILHVPLKAFPAAALESGHAPLRWRFRSLYEMNYSKDLCLSIPPSQRSCSQWIIGCTCTLTRNSFHTKTVYKVLLRASFHKSIFLSEKWLPLNMPIQLHCVFAKDMNTYEFLLHYHCGFLSFDLYSVPVLISELKRPKTM